MWVPQLPYHQQFMESDPETFNMAFNNIVTGATRFELAKTYTGGPR